MWHDGRNAHCGQISPDRRACRFGGPRCSWPTPSPRARDRLDRTFLRPPPSVPYNPVLSDRKPRSRGPTVTGLKFSDVLRKRWMAHAFEQRPVEPELVDACSKQRCAAPRRVSRRAAPSWCSTRATPSDVSSASSKTRPGRMMRRRREDPHGGGDRARRQGALPRPMLAARQDRVGPRRGRGMAGEGLGDRNGDDVHAAITCRGRYRPGWIVVRDRVRRAGCPRGVRHSRRSRRRQRDRLLSEMLLAAAQLVAGAGRGVPDDDRLAAHPPGCSAGRVLLVGLDRRDLLVLGGAWDTGRDASRRELGTRIGRVVRHRWWRFARAMVRRL